MLYGLITHPCHSWRRVCHTGRYGFSSPLLGMNATWQARELCSRCGVRKPDCKRIPCPWAPALKDCHGN
jgi:hypothetical protein